ncbi:MAG: DUF4394 domain-containing protein [Thermoleophilaceae bacterium]|nr:DUF4394 domain-containing protein [Thermoleophilaceae bacterium]
MQPAFGAFTPRLAGTTYGFDFSAETDRLRVLGDTGQSFRLRSTTLGSSSDGPIRLVGGGKPAMAGAAYSGNRIGSKSSRLYAIDHSRDRLYRLTTANSTATSFESIGRIGAAVGPRMGFDISGTEGWPTARSRSAPIPPRRSTACRSRAGPAPSSARWERASSSWGSPHSEYPCPTPRRPA